MRSMAEGMVKLSAAHAKLLLAQPPSSHLLRRLRRARRLLPGGRRLSHRFLALDLLRKLSQSERLTGEPTLDFQRGFLQCSLSGQARLLAQFRRRHGGDGGSAVHRDLRAPLPLPRTRSRQTEPRAAVVVAAEAVGYARYRALRASSIEVTEASLSVAWLEPLFRSSSATAASKSKWRNGFSRTR
jgi:hypothetical protein